MPPVIDSPALAIMGASEHPLMLADRLPLSDDHDPVGIDPQAHRAVGEGRRHAVAIALQVDEAGRRNALGVFDEAVERPGHCHQVPDLLAPYLGDRAGLRAVPGLGPQLPASGLQPLVQGLQRGEVRHGLPEPMTGILYVLLDLPLLPAGGRVAELRLEQEVAHHGREADVDLALLAPADFIDGRSHVVVDVPRVARVRRGENMGHFSMEKSVPTGSTLNGNQQAWCATTAIVARARPSWRLSTWRRDDWKERA